MCPIVQNLLAVASPAFDFSIFELLLPLVAGGTVCIADKSIPKNPDYFEQTTKKWQINCFTGTPTMFTMMTMGGWIPQTDANSDIRWRKCAKSTTQKT